MSNEEKFFYLDDSPIYKDKLVLRMNFEKFLFPKGTSGSFGVFPARVMNLSYAQFLRYCRDRLGAELIGKNTRYVVPYFEHNNETRMFVKLLNTRMKYIMNEHEFPYEYKEEEDGSITRIPFNGDDETNTGTIGEV